MTHWGCHADFPSSSAACAKNAMGLESYGMRRQSLELTLGGVVTGLVLGRRRLAGLAGPRGRSGTWLLPPGAAGKPRGTPVLRRVPPAGQRRRRELAEERTRHPKLHGPAE